MVSVGICQLECTIPSASRSYAYRFCPDGFVLMVLSDTFVLISYEQAPSLVSNRLYGVSYCMIVDHVHICMWVHGPHS